MSRGADLPANIQTEYVERKNRFVCRLFEAATLAEARELLALVKRRDAGARRVVWCYSSPAESGRGGDGEVGAPGDILLAMLQRYELPASGGRMMVISRFFGSKLGIPGVRRAFAEAGSQLIESAGLKRCR